MSHQLNKQDGTTAISTQPGLGVTIAICDTSANAGTQGYCPGCILITTTTCKLYVNTGTVAAATWTVAGSQS